jgi:hypothetical protein
MHAITMLALARRTSVLLAGTAAAVIVLGVALIYLLATGYHDWSAQSKVFAQHVSSGQHAACEQIRTACRSVVDPTSARDGANRQKGSRSLEDSKYDLLFDILECNKTESIKQGIKCDTWNPGSFAQFFISKVSDENAIGKSLAGWIALILTFLTMKLIAAESHTGWSRLSILVGGISGAASIAYSVSEQLRFAETVVLLFGSLLLGVSAPLLIRRLVTWVHAGFASQVSPSTASVTDESVAKVSQEVSVTSTRNALLALGFIVFMALAFLFNPEKTIETFISTLVQAVALVAIVYAARAIYNAFMIWRK